MAQIEFVTVSRTRATARFYPYAFYRLRGDDIGKLLISSGEKTDISSAVSLTVRKAIRRWLMHRGIVCVHTSPVLLECLQTFSSAADRPEAAAVLGKIINDIRRLSAHKECIVISCVHPAAIA